jgi:hypothetical protein
MEVNGSGSMEFMSMFGEPGGKYFHSMIGVNVGVHANGINGEELGSCGLRADHSGSVILTFE